MKKQILMLLFFSGSVSVGRRAYLENDLEVYRTGRNILLELVLALKRENKSIFRKTKLQNQISELTPFPCDLQNVRSSQKPESVHKLRPGDIDIIAALGDSLTAGVGITAINFLELLIEERGKSFTIGGEGDWRQYLTLPNILKVFNPNLTGYSSTDCLTIHKESRFNVAEPIAISEDLPYMAKELIKRMRLDHNININKDWKMITIFIGSNNFCSQICYLDDPFMSLKKHEFDLIQTLRLLRDNLPKTIINLIPPPHIQILVELQFTDPVCTITHLVECPCFFGIQFESKKKLLYSIMHEWQKLDLEIPNLPEFDKNDFTVLVQPFVLNYAFPKTQFNFVNNRYIAPDCFHFSQKMHAKAANDLWNNILEPVGMKAYDGNNLFKKFNCPNEQNPYIFTKRNSLKIH